MWIQWVHHAFLIQNVLELVKLWVSHLEAPWWNYIFHHRMNFISKNKRRKSILSLHCIRTWKKSKVSKYKSRLDGFFFFKNESDRLWMKLTGRAHDDAHIGHTRLCSFLRKDSGEPTISWSYAQSESAQNSIIRTQRGWGALFSYLSFLYTKSKLGELSGRCLLHQNICTSHYAN